jgi:hypothetical protein
MLENLLTYSSNKRTKVSLIIELTKNVPFISYEILPFTLFFFIVLVTSIKKLSIFCLQRMCLYLISFPSDDAYVKNFNDIQASGLFYIKNKKNEVEEDCLQI